MMKTKAKFFESRWDVLIISSAILVSAFIFLEKILFLTKVYGVGLDTLSTIQLLAINIAAYFVICSWVFILLAGNRSWLLRFYILFIGFYLCSLLRMIEIGESSTRQGVDFALMNHLVLTSIGFQAWKVFLFEWFIKLHVFFIFLLGLFIKYRLGNITTSKYLHYSSLVCVLALCLSFVNPNIGAVPSSLRQNSLVYLIQSAWFPVKGLPILTQRPSKQAPSGTENAVTEIDSVSKPFLASAKGKNVVIITLESTGANMLDIYENNDAVQGSTPFLSEFAQTSLKFNNASAVMTSTSKSLVSILCGIEPYLSIEVFEVTLGVPVECLPSRLSKIGYETIYFQSATKLYENRDKLASRMGFQEFISLDELPNEDKLGARLIGPFGLEDKVLLNEHQHWVDKQKTHEKPFMAFYLTLAQHHPYLHGKKANRAGENLSTDYQNNFVDSLKYIDGFLKEIVEQYKKAGLYNNTIFIVVGDHGEAFGLQHPTRFHNNSLYREGLWVPFFIVNKELFPEIAENNEVLSLIDVAPSIEYLLGMDEFKDYRGYSALAVPDNRKVYASCWYKNRCLAVIDRHYKYIYNFEDSAAELYDINKDVHEQNNIAQQFPEIAKRYQEELFLWYSDVMFFYTDYYESIDKQYFKNASSYYQFPKDFYAFKKQVKKNEKNINE